ncbi:MAG: hypothetical protein WBP81_33460 [Solirubrobacteraceae bacterium]
MNQNQDHHSVRKIVLPSGRSIEVIRFNETETQERQGLHLCPGCGSDLVQPISWNEISDEHWELTLECPNCWWSTEGVFPCQEIHELEERLDGGLADMLGDLKRLAHANMTDQIERFIGALQADLILPEDF